MPKRFESSVVTESPIVFLFAACLLAAGIYSPAAPAAAAPLSGPEAAIGQWDLSLAASPKKCRLALRGEKVHGGYFVGMPLGCRRALPVLSNISCWNMAGDNQIDLADVYGKPLLRFAAAEAGALAATGPQGESYRLDFVEGAPAPRDARGAGAPAKAVAAAPAPAAGALVRSADVPGRYTILREEGRDTGCMVTLGSDGAAQGGSRAFLSPACRDQGIVIFDPAGWRLVAGRLVLTARKGHTTELSLQPDGTWKKDSKEGKSLALKKF